MNFEAAERWQRCLWRCSEGEYITRDPPLTKRWNELVDEARRVDCAVVPEPLSSNRFLHLLFLIVFPHRVTPEAIRHLGWKFDRTWFVPPPISS
jgi:hypothetical protein